MHRPKASGTVFLLLATGLIAAAAAAASSIAEYHAVAVNMSNVGKTGMSTLDIGIERWTTDEEAAKLKDVLIEKGGDRLTPELQKIKPRVGFIRSSTGGLGWNIQYARKIDLPTGSVRVIFATDRPMSFQERANQPRSADYDLMVAELRIGADGKGEGKLVPMAKVTYDKDAREIEIENYANEPIRLTEITQVKPKAAKTN